MCAAGKAALAVFPACAGKSDELVLERERRGCRSRTHAQLGEDVLHVAGDRVLADDELGCDLAVRASRRDEPEHLELAVRQAMRPAPGAEPGEVRRGAEHPIRLTRSIELEARRLLVAERAAGEPGQLARPRHLVARAETRPLVPGTTKCYERLRRVPCGQMHRAPC